MKHCKECQDPEGCCHTGCDLEYQKSKGLPAPDCSAGEDCIQCDNSGTVVISTDDEGNIDEIGPCEWCHREPNSKFNKQNQDIEL